MILDTSAVVAVVRREEGAARLLVKMSRAESLAIGAPTLVEATVVLGRRFGSAGLESLDRFLEEEQVTLIPFGQRHWRAARSAFIRFGKGRHPASLNFGDCMTYATASITGQPLLFTGNDFAQTDIPPA
ncbi:MAG: type II toxin-antitoxin system VapC family toxin [Actinomycetota bacterium]|nr:type II toxin-antitoxin system VapC family toxin [Actinomycetota bacterium]